MSRDTYTRLLEMGLMATIMAAAILGGVFYTEGTQDIRSQQGRDRTSGIIKLLNDHHTETMKSLAACTAGKR